MGTCTYVMYVVACMHAPSLVIRASHDVMGRARTY
jgi:hypothetical protein